MILLSSFTHINSQGQPPEKSNTDWNHYHRGLLLRSVYSLSEGWKCAPAEGLSTCYPVVTNLFSGRTDIFLFLFPLPCLLVSSCIPIVSLQTKESKRTNLVFFCLSIGLEFCKLQNKNQRSQAFSVLPVSWMWKFSHGEKQILFKHTWNSYRNRSWIKLQRNFDKFQKINSIQCTFYNKIRNFNKKIASIKPISLETK